MNAENRNYKWVVLGLLFVAHFVVQGVRQLYYASIPPIRADLGLGPAALGMVATVFLVVYGVCAPCASVVADLLRRKTIIVIGFFVFSVGILATGFGRFRSWSSATASWSRWGRAWCRRALRPCFPNSTRRRGRRRWPCTRAPCIWA